MKDWLKTGNGKEFYEETQQFKISNEIADRVNDKFSSPEEKKIRELKAIADKKFEEKKAAFDERQKRLFEIKKRMVELRNNLAKYEFIKDKAARERDSAEYKKLKSEYELLMGHKTF